MKNYDIEKILGSEGLSVFRRLIIDLPVHNLTPDGFSADEDIGNRILNEIKKKMEEDD